MPLYQSAPFIAGAARGSLIASAFPFATLITPAGDEPWISHLILLPDPDDANLLYGHLPRRSGHSRVLFQQPSIALFHGEHGYVSAGWYRSAQHVPTWNYRVAHAHGQAEVLPDAELQPLLARLVSHFEGAGGWNIQQVPAAALQAMQQAIYGFRLRVTRWDVTEKLSQNRNEADFAGVLSGLQQGDDAARQMAGIMCQCRD